MYTEVCTAVFAEEPTGGNQKLLCIHLLKNGSDILRIQSLAAIGANVSLKLEN